MEVGDTVSYGSTSVLGIVKLLHDDDTATVLVPDHLGYPYRWPLALLRPARLPTTAEMEARELARYAAKTGKERVDIIDYMQGVRWGTVSEAARDYARRILRAMGETPAA